MPQTTNYLRLPELDRLAVVVLNWNAARETIHCVHSVQLWKECTPAIWIVDNGSMDGSADLISRACLGAHLIRNEQNRGFGGGNNRGIEQALSTGAQAILLLNNDAFIEERDLLQLFATLRQNDVAGFVGPLLLGEDGHTVLSAGGRDIATTLNTHLKRARVATPTYPVDYVPGTVVLIRAEALRAVGIFDEAYFFSCEMADLCERARQRGYQSIIDTRAQAIHSQHAPSQLRETLYTYYSLRNRFLFTIKFRSNWRWAIEAFWAAYGLGMSIKARMVHKPLRARAAFLAVHDGLHGRFGGQNERVLAPHPASSHRER
jgi:GT2 family glycosyltransferase